MGNLRRALRVSRAWKVIARDQESSKEVEEGPHQARFDFLRMSRPFTDPACGESLVFWRQPRASLGNGGDGRESQCPAPKAG